RASLAPATRRATALRAVPAAVPRVAATPLPLLMVDPSSSCCGRNVARSELAVIALLEGVEQVGGGVDLAVVLHLLVAAELDGAAVLQLEPVGGVGQVRLLHQHALEGGRVEAEGGAALQPALV